MSFLHKAYNEKTGATELWLEDKPQEFAEFEYIYISKMSSVAPTFEGISDAISSLIDDDKTAMIPIQKQLDGIKEAVKEIIKYQRDHGKEIEKNREAEIRRRYGIK